MLHRKTVPLLVCTLEYLQRWFLYSSYIWTSLLYLKFSVSLFTPLFTSHYLKDLDCLLSFLHKLMSNSWGFHKLLHWCRWKISMHIFFFFCCTTNPKVTRWLWLGMTNNFIKIFIYIESFACYFPWIILCKGNYGVKWPNTA